MLNFNYKSFYGVFLWFTDGSIQAETRLKKIMILILILIWIKIP
jgi:hypothetical protein